MRVWQKFNLFGGSTNRSCSSLKTPFTSYLSLSYQQQVCYNLVVMTFQRILYFIRHGQYKDKEDIFGGVLTETGIKQSRLLGERLRHIPIAKIWSSDMNRAIETATIIQSTMPNIPVQVEDWLRELIPSAVPNLHVPLLTRKKAKKRLDFIEQKLFTIPNKIQYEIISCHSNLIRNLFCRRLQTPQKAWLRLAVYHCGMTTFGITKQGKIQLLSFNDSGHLPIELQTIV